MKIVIDRYLDAQGNVAVTHILDTSDPAVQAMLTALKGNAAAQTTAGFGVITNLPAYPGQTRWQAILGEVVRLNDTVARPLLGV